MACRPLSGKVCLGRPDEREPCISRGKRRVRGVVYEAEADADVRVNFNFANVMGRAASEADAAAARRLLEERGYRLGPYNIGRCLHFYLRRSIREAVEVAEWLEEAGVRVERLAVVTAAWLVEFPGVALVAFRRLIDYGFALRLHYNDAIGVFNGATVRLFANGRALVFAPLLEDEARRLARQLYAFLLEAGAVVA